MVDATEPEPVKARLKMTRLVVPEGSNTQAEILGRGPEAAPAVVSILQQIGVLA